jgi:ribonuclease P/MRP protein subunit POP3
VGINEVTKTLETEVRLGRQTVITTNKAPDVAPVLTRVIFICYEDLDTPAIVAHLPQLVALCNAARPDDCKVKVVQLPAGAQTSLVDALGFLKRISVMALDVSPILVLS